MRLKFCFKLLEKSVKSGWIRSSLSCYLHPCNSANAYSTVRCVLSPTLVWRPLYFPNPFSSLLLSNHFSFFSQILRK